MKNLLFFGPFSEFHVFNFYNNYILDLHKQYDKITSVVPETSACIVASADEIICASQNYLKKVNADYPTILENSDREKLGLFTSGFMNDVIYFLKNKHNVFKLCDFFDIFYYQSSPENYIKTIELEGGDYFFKPKVSFPYGKQDYYNGIEMIFDGFHRISKKLSENYKILPFKEDFDAVKNRYGNLFLKSKKNYIYVTRNFKNKQPDSNTDFNNFIKVINFLTSNGIGVINIGFPQVSYGIKNDLYYEIKENLSYSEFLCLNYLANGLIVKGDCGAFSTHMCSLLNIFIETPEWHSPDIFFTERIKRKDLITFKIYDKNGLNEDTMQCMLNNYDFNRDFISKEKIIKIF